MDEVLLKLRNRFPTIPQNALTKIYKCRMERMKLLMHFGMPEELRWVIEAKVRLSGEFSFSFDKHMPGMGKSTYAKRRRAKRMGVCFRCARWNCNTNCRNIGMASINREDKIQFIKDGLSKESLDNVLLTLDAHPSGQVHGVILDLWSLFREKKELFSLGNLTVKDPVCQLTQKLEKDPGSSTSQSVSAKKPEGHSA